jgi:hypothetical protein
MQGTIAQIVVLTAYGNYFLQGGAGLPLKEFSLASGSFQFCEFVKFTDLKLDATQREELPYAESPSEWFEKLKAEGMRGVRMMYGSSGRNEPADRMLVGFVGGGGRWLMEAYGDERSEYWESRWQLGDRSRADRKIWRVTYVRILKSKPSESHPKEDLEALKVEFKKVLKEIAEFSHSQKLDNFTKVFEAGLAKLDSNTPLEGLYLKDFASEGFLPLGASQLLGAAETAWVFGGMGSWNDMGFEGQTQSQYEKVSEKLYQLLNRAIIAAANSRALPRS